MITLCYIAKVMACHSCDSIQLHQTLSLAGRGEIFLAGVRKQCMLGRSPWPRTVGGLQNMRVASSQQPAKAGPQSHSHKEMNSANNLNELVN